MGKASSNKKVARAAGTGGSSRVAGRRRPWNFYGVIALVVLLGVLGTAFSRHNRNSAIANAGAVAPTVGGTPWHEALAVDICGKVQPNISTTRDPFGLTTNGDGVIQIHPFTKSAAGHNATLGKFASSIGLKVNSAELQLPGGHLYHDGDSCNGVPSHVYVKQFGFVGSTFGTLQKADPGQVRLADGAMLTLAFVPAADKGAIPAPPAAVQAALKKAAATPAPVTPKPSTTLPGATSRTTTQGATPVTSAPPSSAPASSAPPAAAPSTAPPTSAAKP